MSRHKFEGTNYPKVSLWDAICLHALWPNATDVTPYLSKLASPGARERVEQLLLSALKISHEEDVEYIPYINKHYPKLFRQHAASLFCTGEFPPRKEDPTQGVSIVIPDGIFDDAPLAVMLGGIAWFAACLLWPGFEDSDDEHNESWHRWFCCKLEDHFDALTVYPLPKLPTQGFAFCKELYFDCSEEFGDKEPKRILKTFAAVVIFLTNKNVLLQCCPRCQILYTQFFSDATLSTIVNELSANTDASGILSQYTSAEFY